MGEDAAGEIAVEDFAFPGGEHVADAPHALGVPENFASDAEFVGIEIDGSAKVHRSHEHDLHVMRLIKIVLDVIQDARALIDH